MSFDDVIARVDRAAIRVFGESTPVLYLPDEDYAEATPVTGIFDEQYVLAKGTAEAGVEALGPAVFLRLEDLPTDPEDDDPTLTIRDVDYRVIERRPDGMGGIVLALRRVT